MTQFSHYLYEMAVARTLLKRNGIVVMALYLKRLGWSADTAIAIARGN